MSHLTTYRVRVASAAIVLAVQLAGGGRVLGETPRDQKSPVPGFADGKGPTGPVTLKIVSPKPDEVVPQTDGKGRVELKFELAGIELFKDEATKSAQEITIFVDHIAKTFSSTDVSKPFLFPNLPKGTHTLRAVVTRPWGETIKEPGAYAQVTFHVGEKDGKNTPVAGLPVVTVVRPDPKISKDQAGKVLIDTYVAGCAVAEDEVAGSCRLIYRLDEQPEATMRSWAPITLENVPVGKHSFTTGLRREGKFFENDKFSIVSFWFEVVDGPVPAPAAAAPAPAPVKPK